MRNSNKYQQHPAFKIMLKGLRREEMQQCWVLGVLTFLGLMLFILNAHQYQVLGALSFGIMLVCGRFLFIKIKHLKDTEERLTEILLARPLDVVWVYTVIMQRMPFGFQINRNGLLYLKLADGDEISISLPENHLRLTSKFLNRLLPEATFGYTDERAQWYNAHPEMLRKMKEY